MENNHGNMENNHGSSIGRVSGRRELLPSASEQILRPLRFQETRRGSGVCHFSFVSKIH